MRGGKTRAWPKGKRRKGDLLKVMNLRGWKGTPRVAVIAERRSVCPSDGRPRGCLPLSAAPWCFDWEFGDDDRVV
jgi:hypothetical protein